MPILKQEIDIHPPDLLDRPEPGQWSLLYTRSRREKDLMRHLLARGLPFYGPCAKKTYRSPAGRARTSWLPVFTNYVFLAGGPEECSIAKESSCISSVIPIADPAELVEDLRRVAKLISCDAPVQVEDMISAGEPVRIKSGPFAGCEGMVTQRRGRHVLTVTVRTIGQSVSVAIDDFAVERM